MISYILPAANRIVKQEISAQARNNKLDNKIIEVLDKNAEFFKRKKNFDYHPYYYITLDQIAKIASNASEVYDSMVRLTDASYYEDNNPIAYLYAHLIEENKKVVVKICLLRPPPEKQGAPRDATKMCQKAAESSIPVLDKIIKTRASKLLAVPMDNPEHLLIKNIIVQGETPEAATQKLEIYPNAISFESELYRLLNTGFRLVPNAFKFKNKVDTLDSGSQQHVFNVKPVPILHVLSDWIKYLKESGQIFSLTHNYHIVNHKENPSLVIEEIHRHVLAHKEALKKVVLPRIHGAIVQASNTGYANAYILWKEYTSNRENTDSVEEAKLILQVMSAARLGELNEAQIGLSLKNIRRSVGILEALLEYLDTSLNTKMSELSQDICTQIEYNSKNRKLLSLISLNEELRKIDLVSAAKDLNTLKSLFDKIAERFAYLVKLGNLSDTEDFQDIYFVDASRLTGIIANLAKLTLKNKTFSEQYEAAKTIKKNLLNDIKAHPELDSKMSLPEITEARNIIKEMDRVLKFGEEKKTLLRPKEYDITKGFLLSALYLGTIFILATISNPYFIILLTVYPFLIRPFFSKGSRNPKEIVRKEETSNTQFDLTRQIQKYIKQKIKVYNSKTGGIGPPQIMTNDQLEELLDFTDAKNIVEIKKAFPHLKDKTPTQIKEIFKSTFLKSTASIVFRGNEVPRGNYLRQKGVPFPQEIYIEKSSLGNPAYRRDLANSFRKEFEMLIPVEKDKQMYYRKLIEILENPKEYTKYLKT